MRTFNTVVVGRMAWLLLACSAALAVCNWVIQPARSVAWGVALALTGVMAVVLRAARQGGGDGRGGRGAASIPDAVVFAAAIMTLSLMAALVSRFATRGVTSLSLRAMMVTLGAFLVLTGNSLPKTLTPLAALRCDPVKTQAIQRFAGWTWVLAGLTFANVWLILSVDAAWVVSMILLPAAIIAVVAQVVRLRAIGNRV